MTRVAYYDPAQPLDPDGKPLVEQFRISGLVRDDDIEFVADPYQANAGTPAEVTVLPLDIGDLNERSNDFVGVIDGGPGDDILIGTAGRDRLDGGSGSDTLYGLAGDDRLWGDSTAGEESASTSDYDILYGGRGDDDLIGGPGINDLYAWTQNPQPAGDTPVRRVRRPGESRRPGVRRQRRPERRRVPGFGRRSRRRDARRHRARPHARQPQRRPAVRRHRASPSCSATAATTRCTAPTAACSSRSTAA